MYEDPIYSELADSLYLQTGLERGEQCIFATQGEPEKISERMAARGIRVDFYARENLLYFCRLSNARVDEGGLSRGVERILDYLFSFIDSNHPSRILSEPWVGKISSSLDMEANMEVELKVHAAFRDRECSDDAYSLLKDFNGSLICQYFLSEIQPIPSEWYEGQISDHDTAIYLPKVGPGLVLDAN